MEVAPLLKAAGEGKVVPPPRVATLEGGPAYPATKVATQVICTKGGGESGAATKSRTRDLLITSHVYPINANIGQ
jgi:hypothetical protein